MSIDWLEAQQEQWLEELYEEHKGQAVEEFTAERLDTSKNLGESDGI